MTPYGSNVLAKMRLNARDNKIQTFPQYAKNLTVKNHFHWNSVSSQKNGEWRPHYISQEHWTSLAKK